MNVVVLYRGSMYSRYLAPVYFLGLLAVLHRRQWIWELKFGFHNISDMMETAADCLCKSCRLTGLMWSNSKFCIWDQQSNWHLVHALIGIRTLQWEHNFRNIHGWSHGDVSDKDSYSVVNDICGFVPLGSYDLAFLWKLRSIVSTGTWHKQNNQYKFKNATSNAK